MWNHVLIVFAGYLVIGASYAWMRWVFSSLSRLHQARPVGGTARADARTVLALLLAWTVAATVFLSLRPSR